MAFTTWISRTKAAAHLLDLGELHQEGYPEHYGTSPVGDFLNWLTSAPSISHNLEMVTCWGSADRQVKASFRQYVDISSWHNYVSERRNIWKNLEYSGESKQEALSTQTGFWD